jgi:hypothetical protein
MFAKTIIDSDAFMEMPLSAQALYFHLSMRADDDGFINNPKKLQRMICATDDDFKLLIAKRFVLTFESGVIVIKHWKLHNYIQKDRYKPTIYAAEKAMIEIKENGVYTECIQDVSKMDTQVSIGKSIVSLELVEGSANVYSDNGNDESEIVGNSSFEYIGGKIGKGVVLLTQDQQESLLDKLGLDAFNHYVEKLANFIIDKQAKVGNHYSTILKWAKEDAAV